MFTGIIERTASVATRTRSGPAAQLVIDLENLADDVKIGDSISINGACLTVTELEGSRASFDVSTETLDRTALGELSIGAKVNIERSLRVGDRLGGHFVQGHVDGVGIITQKIEEPGQCTIRFSVAAELTDMMIEKGSSAVDGVSLTITDLAPGEFSVAIIPHTLASTNLGFKRVGERVNVEVDMIGKWIAKLLRGKNGTRSGVTEKMLAEHEFL